MSKQLWVVYDDRAMLQDTFDCAVLEACSSEYEAMNKAQAGIVFKYDIADKNELINEQKIGPNKAWVENNDSNQL